MKLINLFIRELENCSLGGDFRVWRHDEICQFDRFSLEINFKRARSCNYGIPRLGSSKKNIVYTTLLIVRLIIFSIQIGSTLKGNGINSERILIRGTIKSAV